jgi:hypothetical protein
VYLKVACHYCPDVSDVLSFAMPSAFRGPVKTDADDPNVWSGRALQVDFA